MGLMNFGKIDVEPKKEKDIDNEIIKIVSNKINKKLKNKEIDFWVNDGRFSFYDNDDIIRAYKRVEGYNAKTIIEITKRQRIEDWEVNEREENDNEFLETERYEVYFNTTDTRNLLNLIDSMKDMKKEILNDREKEKIYKYLKG